MPRSSSGIRFTRAVSLFALALLLFYPYAISIYCQDDEESPKRDSSKRAKPELEAGTTRESTEPRGYKIGVNVDLVLMYTTVFDKAGRFVSGVAFGVKEDFAARPGAMVDLVYRLSENVWNGISPVELKLLDSRMASVTSAQV